MEEEREIDVREAEPSSVEEKQFNEDVNTVQESSPEPEPQPQEQEEVTPSPQEVKPEVVLDDRPIENVAWETKRKLDELMPSIERRFEDLKTVIENTSQKAQEPQYSKAQLQAYAMEPSTTTEQRLWAFGEVDKMEKDERRTEYSELMRSTEKRTTTENKKGQAAQWVAQTFPEVIIKDGNGNTVGWNTQSPLLQRANDYINRNSNLKDDPEGFMAAVKMAAFDLGVSRNLSNKVNRVAGQLKKEQRKQLASVGGTQYKESPESAIKVRMATLKDEYNKTGSRDIFAEIIKLKKINPFI